MMQKAFHFDSPREPYHCDAAVVWCFDSRFRLVLAKFLKRLGIATPDVIQIAGGAKCLATPAQESDRAFVLDQIQKSINLHGTTRVVLMLHSDCGAYGGLAAFQGDAGAEARHHQEEMRCAVECVSQAAPGIQVEACFVDFEGVWSVD